MLPFVCGARCLRSTLRFSTKTVRRSLITRKQGKLVRAACVTDVADGKWMNHRIQEESRTFVSAACQYNLVDACGSILVLAAGDTTTSLTEVSAGDDGDEVTSRAGKRKHWINALMKDNQVA